MYTANTMASAIECMGFALPYNSSIPAENPNKLSEAERHALAIKNLLEKDIKPLDIISKKSFLNRVKKKEKLFLDLLKDINNNLNVFSEVKSKGLWLSVTFSKDSNIQVDELIAKSHQNGLMILKANIDTVRFSPSLIIEDVLIRKSMFIFEKALTQIQSL